MEVEQLVVFLCKSEEWDKYVTSNPGFTPKGAWLFHEDTGKKRVFLVTPWSKEDRKNASELLDDEEGPDATQLPWCKELSKEEILETVKIGKKSEVIIFIHWGDTSTRETMMTPSINLQGHLNKIPKTRTWKIYSLSSKNMGIVIGQHPVVFDVEDPVIPVSNFEAWYEMYKLWWEGGREAVESSKFGSETKFPWHKDGRVTKVVSTDSSGPKVDDAGKNPNSQEPQKAVPKHASVWNAIAGIMMGILALVPIGLTIGCLCAMSFQAKTTRGTVAMLLVVLLATAFAEIILGWLFLSTRAPRGEQAND